MSAEDQRNHRQDPNEDEGQEDFDWDDENILVLEDEEGRESRFKILFDALFVGEKQYVILMPVDDVEIEEPEMVILRVDEGEDGERILSTIDDDDEWARVLQAFDELEIEEELAGYDIVLEEEDKDADRPAPKNKKREDRKR